MENEQTGTDQNENKTKRNEHEAKRNEDETETNAKWAEQTKGENEGKRTTCAQALMTAL